jgi:hypothetical protein
LGIALESGIALAFFAMIEVRAPEASRLAFFAMIEDWTPDRTAAVARGTYWGRGSQRPRLARPRCGNVPVSNQPNDALPFDDCEERAPRAGLLQFLG